MEREAGWNLMGTRYSLVLARLAAMAEREVERTLSTDGLRIEEWRVLDQLATFGPTTMTNLASAALLTGPTLTRTVDRLASLGFVHRTASSDDRRRVEVNVAQRGLRLHKRLLPQVQSAELLALHSDGADIELRRLLSLLLPPLESSSPPLR